jgi:hypothetical protein
VCPQCGTRADEWDDGGDGEDVYVPALHKCIGCQVIADKQAEIPQGSEGHGFRVHLIPVAAQAALQVLRDLKRRDRGRDDEDEEDD